MAENEDFYMAVDTDATVETETIDELRLMHGGELVRLIIDDGGEGDRAARAVGLIAERQSCYYLFDELDRLCRLGASDQLQALAVLRHLPQPPVDDDSYGQQARMFLLRLVDDSHDPAIVQAALDALEAIQAVSQEQESDPLR